MCNVTGSHEWLKETVNKTFVSHFPFPNTDWLEPSLLNSSIWLFSGNIVSILSETWDWPTANSKGYHHTTCTKLIGDFLMSHFKLIKATGFISILPNLCIFHLQWCWIFGYIATAVTIHHKWNLFGGISGLICVWAHVILFVLLFWIVEVDNRAWMT